MFFLRLKEIAKCSEYVCISSQIGRTVLGDSICYAGNKSV